MTAIDRLYREAVRWVADNDDDSETSVTEIRGYLSVALVADVFGVSIDTVAEAVARRRARYR